MRPKGRVSTSQTVVCQLIQKESYHIGCQSWLTYLANLKTELWIPLDISSYLIHPHLFCWSLTPHGQQNSALFFRSAMGSKDTKLHSLTWRQKWHRSWFPAGDHPIYRVHPKGGWFTHGSRWGKRRCGKLGITVQRCLSGSMMFLWRIWMDLLQFQALTI